MYSQNLVDDDARIAEIVRSARRVAVLGMKAQEDPDQAAWFVPEYLIRQGIELFPVPVGSDAEEILGQKAYRRLADVPGPIDVVDVFRRSKDVEAHVEDLVALAPRCVWLQLGIRNDRAAEALARAGILVVQDRCLMAEHRRVRAA
jgi:hypothetical protein